MLTKDTWKRGFKNGLVTSWELGKVIVPVYIFVTILEYTMILDWFAGYLEPMMSLLGLRGEAALALVMGMAINIYAAIGVIMSIPFDMKEVTILAVMLSLAHSLPVETAIGAKTGVKTSFLLLVRMGLALIAGLILNIIL
ncbi:hypothetical protein GGQ84_002448 [Desulfitispora alkaliphila]|uniref:nucleoside recognition domain-containing protein n=1 Tax=Desulfitispora alkaliphila TaxID=622674 RepID=UPI003D1CA53E